jgi:hypothetical protein
MQRRNLPHIGSAERELGTVAHEFEAETRKSLQLPGGAFVSLNLQVPGFPQKWKTSVTFNPEAFDTTLAMKIYIEAVSTELVLVKWMLSVIIAISVANFAKQLF